MALPEGQRVEAVCDIDGRDIFPHLAYLPRRNHFCITCSQCTYFPKKAYHEYAGDKTRLVRFLKQQKSKEECPDCMVYKVQGATKVNPKKIAVVDIVRTCAYCLMSHQGDI